MEPSWKTLAECPIGFGKLTTILPETLPRPFEDKVNGVLAEYAVTGRNAEVEIVRRTWPEPEAIVRALRQQGTAQRYEVVLDRRGHVVVIREAFLRRQVMADAMDSGRLHKL